VQSLCPILGEQRPGYLSCQRVTQRSIDIVEFLTHHLPCFQGLTVVAPPEFDQLGEQPVVCRAINPLFIVLGGDHPTLELLGFGLGLEALRIRLPSPAGGYRPGNPQAWT